jgi:16S rRNA (adenine1518-N6/adenine1519-N6)-dimethyltransferase
MSRPPRAGADAGDPGGHTARKRFGQNFLHDGAVIARIVRVIDPQPADVMLEIGPGLGALTTPLLERLPALHVVEIDRDLAARLRETFHDRPGLVVHAADALRFDFASLAPAGTPLRVVGNLPYNISTPLLFHLLEYGSAIRDMHFMLQKEVVDRVVAGPGSEAYGRLSVAVAARAEAHALFTVGPGAFRPAPKVESAIVRIVPRPAPFAIDDFSAFDRIVTAAFSQRRKQLANALSRLLDESQIRSADVDPRLRPERLSAADFARLANVYARVRQAMPDASGNLPR